MLQYIIVACVIAACVLYAARRLYRAFTERKDGNRCHDCDGCDGCA